MATYRIIVSQVVDRVYEVYAEDKDQALDIYFNYGSSTKFVEERESDYTDPEIEVEEVEE